MARGSVLDCSSGDEGNQLLGTKKTGGGSRNRHLLLTVAVKATEFVNLLAECALLLGRSLGYIPPPPQALRLASFFSPRKARMGVRGHRTLYPGLAVATCGLIDYGGAANWGVIKRLSSGSCAK